MSMDVATIHLLLPLRLFRLQRPHLLLPLRQPLQHQQQHPQLQRNPMQTQTTVMAIVLNLSVIKQQKDAEIY